MKLNLKTINSNHLNEWNQTRNGVNIIGVNDEDIKKFYKDVFVELSAMVPESKFGDFTSEWRKVCQKHQMALEKYLIGLVPEAKDKPEYQEMVSKVILKFRGNLAEILFEAGVLEGAFDWIHYMGYDPVDPHHEQQLDGIGYSTTGIEEHKIGVQIKNWNGYGNSIGLKVFTEVEGMAMALWNRGEIENLIRNEIYGYVVSFDSDAYFKEGVNDDLNKKLGNVKFIDSKKVWRDLMKHNLVFKHIVESL